MAVSDYPLAEVPVGVTCHCPDEAAHQVAALVATGVGQWAASQQVFSEQGRLSAWVRASFLAKFPDIRLPDVGGVL